MIKATGLRADATEHRPVDHTTARIMAVIRAGEAVVFSPVAIAAAVSPVSLTWLVPVLAGFAAWCIIYTWIALTRGLASWLAVGDIATTVLVCLAIGHLVPLTRINDGSGWVAAAASLCVVGLPLVWRAWISIPAGLVVIIAFMTGFWLAGHPELGHEHATMATGQLLASALVMALVRRTSRTADATLAATHEERHAFEVARARRLDEAEQLRLLHDTALTTLTLVSTGVDVPPQILARQTAMDLDAIDRITIVKHEGGDELVELEPLLVDTISRHSHVLAVTSRLVSCRVPAQVGAAFSGAVDEALRNVGRYARTDTADVSMCTVDGTVLVEVSDSGQGFDPSAAPAHRYGIRESIIGRMSLAGGRASLDTAAGTGTRWTLEWRGANPD